MHTKLDQTGLSWFELATANKVDTDVMCQMPLMEKSIVVTDAVYWYIRHWCKHQSLRVAFYWEPASSLFEVLQDGTCLSHQHYRVTKMEMVVQRLLHW